MSAGVRNAKLLAGSGKVLEVFGFSMAFVVPLVRGRLRSYRASYLERRALKGSVEISEMADVEMSTLFCHWTMRRLLLSSYLPVMFQTVCYVSVTFNHVQFSLLFSWASRCANFQALRGQKAAITALLQGCLEKAPFHGL